MTEEQAQFIEAWNGVAEQAYHNAFNKGFWDARTSIEANAGEGLSGAARAAVDTQAIALVICEAAEAIEALRHGNPPDDKIPEFSGVEAELADVLIRIMDLATGRGWRVAEALVAKMSMNQGREKLHGKSF